MFHCIFNEKWTATVFFFKNFEVIKMINIIPNIYQAIRENALAEQKSQNNFELFRKKENNKKKSQNLRNRIFGVVENKQKNKISQFLGTMTNMPYVFESHPESNSKGVVGGSRTLPGLYEYLSENPEIYGNRFPTGSLYYQGNLNQTNTSDLLMSDKKTAKLYGNLGFGQNKTVKFTPEDGEPTDVKFGRKKEKVINFITFEKVNLFPQDN
jgi:hypothetical protein